jgi:hypothetical protein
MARNRSKWDITNNIHAPTAEINTPRIRRSGSQPAERALAPAGAFSDGFPTPVAPVGAAPSSTWCRSYYWFARRRSLVPTSVEPG